ncbi:unnamed protein product [Triticum turgidum subsp. durum]|uniref:NB-ARC domain-containing protein n=1 Tax=Triticum turgidum subsp. durum TaxID=4567 RepID=A0A9R0Q128_TRITD|nr:unnamed protein product [Triticum turgidum subsp. durum]
MALNQPINKSSIMAISWGLFSDGAGVLSNLNACHEFFSWTASVITTIRYRQSTSESSDRDKTAAQPHDKKKFDRLEVDLWKLKTTMPKMLDLIDRVEFLSHKEQAAALLPDIKGAVFDAEDLLDEFDYDVLKLKVECSKNLEPGHYNDTFLEFFDRSSDYIREVNIIQEKLDHVYKQAMDMGLHQAPQKFDKSVRPETTTYFNCVENMVGREKEMKELVGKLGVRGLKRGRTENKARMTELPVLSIVGMGGVGKTTMAQQICKNTNVKKHFGPIIWTCVSDEFDTKRLMKAIIEGLGGDASSDNLNVLIGKLEDRVKSKKFLLVLDDMWDDILKDDAAEWKGLCACLKNGVEGSRILVTTRFPEVAELVGPLNNYVLNGLEPKVFWDFFKFCAFGPTSSCNNRESLELERFGKDIVPKLKGSPLAAKTIGRLLRMELSTIHWKTIKESELWELKQSDTDILPALRLSYMYLPQKLKRCFSICAMFPKDHKFGKDFLADIWIAHGYVEGPQEASTCFDDLANRSFFQKASPQSVKYYVIHDLMHDTAQLVAKDDCFIIKHASDLDKVPSNVRHLSIFTNGNVQCSELKSIFNKKKLRSLVCDESYSKAKDFEPVIDCWFRELTKIRVLSFKLSGVRQLPESMGNSKHLRFLSLHGSVTFSTFPLSVCRLHHLKIIDSSSCVIEKFPPGFSDVLSLEKINSKSFSYSKDHSGKLCLKWCRLLRSPEAVKIMENQMEMLPHWNFQHLQVKDYGGESCPSWLQPNLMPRLRSLEFTHCFNLKSIPFFLQLDGSLGNTSRSDNINRLEELVITGCGQISWQGSVVLPTSLRKLDLQSPGHPMDHFVSCFLDLISLTYLKLHHCHSLTAIPLHVWRSNLPSLEELDIKYCNNLTSIVSEASSSSSTTNGGIKGFSSLAKIRIHFCEKLLSLHEFVKPDCLPAVKTIEISSCKELMSLSVDRLDGLQQLIIGGSDKLNMERAMILPSSLKKLSLNYCQGIESINLANGQLEGSPVLEELYISRCSDLKSIGGAAAVDKILKVYIEECHELKEIQQPCMSCRAVGGVRGKKIKKLARILYQL